MKKFILTCTGMYKLRLTVYSFFFFGKGVQVKLSELLLSIHLNLVIAK